MRAYTWARLSVWDFGKYLLSKGPGVRRWRESIVDELTHEISRRRCFLGCRECIKVLLFFSSEKWKAKTCHMPEETIWIQQKKDLHRRITYWMTTLWE